MKKRAKKKIKIKEYIKVDIYNGDEKSVFSMFAEKKEYDSMIKKAKEEAEITLQNGGEHAIYFIDYTYLDVDDDGIPYDYVEDKYSIMYYKPVPLTDLEFERRKNKFLQEYDNCIIHVLHKNGKSEIIKKKPCKIIYKEI